MLRPVTSDRSHDVNEVASNDTNETTQQTLPLPAVSSPPTRRWRPPPVRAAASARVVVISVIISIFAFGTLMGFGLTRIVAIRFSTVQASKSPSIPRRVGPS